MESPHTPTENFASASRDGGMNEMDLFIRHAISSLLPYGVVFGSVVLKVPQIVKLLRSWSATGVSMASLCFELTSYVITTSWCLARSMQFKDYGENMFIMVEMAVLLVLVGYLQAKTPLTLAMFLLEAAALAVMSTGYIPRTLHEYLLGVQILFGLGSRVPQILMNYRNRSTGQLSVMTFYLAMLGGVSRLLTTFHNVPLEKGKNIMLLQFSLSVLLNMVIIMQVLMYRKDTEMKHGSVQDSALSEKRKLH